MPAPYSSNNGERWGDLSVGDNGRFLYVGGQMESIDLAAKGLTELTASAPSAGLVEAGVTPQGAATAGVSTATVNLAPIGGTAALTYALAGWTSLGGGLYSEAGTYGSVMLDTTHNTLTYTLNNTAAATIALGIGATATDSFTIEVGDGITNATDVVSFSVTGTDVKPTLTGHSLFAANTQPSVETASALLAGAADVKGLPLQVISVGEATHGTVALDAQGDAVFTPDAGYVGSASYAYTASDGMGGTATGTVQIQVLSPPVAGSAPTVTATDGAAIDIGYATAIGLVADSSGTPLTVSAASLAAGSAGVVALDPTHNTVDFTPAAGFAGTAVINVTVTDGDGLSVVQPVDVNVVVQASANPASVPAPVTTPTFAHTLISNPSPGVTVFQDFDAFWSQQDATITTVTGSQTLVQHFDGSWNELSSTVTNVSGGLTVEQVFNDSDWVMTSATVTSSSGPTTEVQQFNAQWVQTSATTTTNLANGAVEVQQFDGGWNQTGASLTTHPNANQTEVQTFNAAWSQTGATITTVNGFQTTTQIFDSHWNQTGATILNTLGGGASNLYTYNANWTLTAETDTATNGSTQSWVYGVANGDLALAAGTAHSTTFVLEPGQVMGDTISGLHTLNLGGSIHDVIDFEGFGSGAQLTQISATQWTVSSATDPGETFTLTGGASLAAGDYAFIPHGPSISIGALAGTDVLGAAAVSAGVTVTGTSTGVSGAGAFAGETLTVNLGGTAYQGTVGADGTWSISLGASGLAGLASGQAYALTVSGADASGHGVSATTEVLVDAPGSPLGAHVQVANGSAQTLTADGAADTLWGSAVGGETFAGTAAQLSGDVLVNFAQAGDKLDLTDLGFTGQTANFVEDHSGAYGTLTVGETSVLLFGQFAASGFHIASDGGSGLIVTYTSTTTAVPLIAPNEANVSTQHFY